MRTSSAKGESSDHVRFHVSSTSKLRAPRQAFHSARSLEHPLPVLGLGFFELARDDRVGVGAHLQHVPLGSLVAVEDPGDAQRRAGNAVSQPEIIAHALHYILAERVRIGRAGGVCFVDREVFERHVLRAEQRPDGVDRTRGDDPLDARLRGSLVDVEAAVGIGADQLAGTVGRAGTRDGGDVRRSVHAPHRGPESFVVGSVADDVFRTVIQIEIVSRDDAHAVPALEQRGDRCRADLAGAAGDENVHQIRTSPSVLRSFSMASCQPVRCLYRSGDSLSNHGRKSSQMAWVHGESI